MKIGCCISLFDERIFSLPGLGVDYAEIGISELASHSLSDIDRRAERLSETAVDCYSANLLFPGNIRLTGNNTDFGAIAEYLDNVLEKASRLGIHAVVFGSGGARSVPADFSRDAAWEQLRRLCAEIIAPAFARYDMTCCIEPLCSRECNILNTCAETARLVRETGKENIRLVVDLYHLDVEQEPRDSLTQYGELLAHAHIASASNSRRIPLEHDGENYGDFFRILNEAGYSGNISLEGNIGEDFYGSVKSSVSYLHSICVQSINGSSNTTF